MSRDLYRDLGVDRDSPEAIIRRAYRRLSKTAHPDGGGTPEKFGALKLAHDVLTDAERRRKYDATGDFEEKAPDNTTAQVYEMVAGALGDAIQAAIGAGRDPETVDLKAGILASLDKGIALVLDEQAKTRKAKDLAKRISKRWAKKRKRGQPEDRNMMEAIIEDQIRMMTQALLDMERRLRILRMAKVWMDDYDFAARVMMTMVFMPTGYP